ncbi:MAG: copper uptake system-associated protein [Amaricoccus sp.]
MLALLRAAALAAVLMPSLAKADDAADIRQLMTAMFERPDAPLDVDPVTVHGDIAIAGWVQGDMGGRALLRKEEGAWELSLCAGNALREPSGLEQLGLPATEAAALAAAVVASEAGLDPGRLAKFARFEGVIRMGADEPSAGGHGG